MSEKLTNFYVTRRSLFAFRPLSAELLSCDVALNWVSPDTEEETLHTSHFTRVSVIRRFLKESKAAVARAARWTSFNYLSVLDDEE